MRQVFVMIAVLLVLYPIAHRMYTLYFKPYHMRIAMDGAENEVFFNVMSVFQTVAVTRDDYKDDGTTIILTVSVRGRKHFNELQNELNKVFCIEFEEIV